MNCQKTAFQLDSTVTYLNCAYMSPLLKTVQEAGIAGIRRKRNPWQISPEQFFGETDELRKDFAKLINSKQPERVVVVPSVSYGMANVARNLPVSKGDQIVVTGEQFPSNVYPWMTLAKERGAELITAEPPDDVSQRGKIWNERILEAISTKTKMVAVGNVHWADGTLFNLEAIRERTRDVGAWLVVDGTQSVGALPFDVQEIEPDALVCAGYKWLLGPYSIGMAYYGPALDGGRPVEENWINRNKSEDFAGLVNYSEDYQPGALRYEVGEHSNFILVPMMLAALRQLTSWGVGNIQDYCRSIVTDSVNRLVAAGYQIEKDEYRAAHLFGIRMGKQHDSDQIKKVLDDEKILVSWRGDSIRISPHVYNTKEELARLSELLLR